MRDNREVLKETLQVIEDGNYFLGEEKVELKLNKEEMQKVILLPIETIKNFISESMDIPFISGRCGYTVTNRDSCTAAIELKSEYLVANRSNRKILVLNFANPVHPGGGVRRGANAQEEDLCRKTTLLASLESKKAEKMYDYHRKLEGYEASDYMILTPKVEILRDSSGKFLSETKIVSVLTCAAPMIRGGRVNLSEEELNTLLFNRITGILHVAAHFGYRHLVLGAWGCGAFGNDAKNMASLFYRALKEFKVNSLKDESRYYGEKDLFDRIEFAVLDRSSGQYNYQSFKTAFHHFYPIEDAEIKRCVKEKRAENKKWADKIRGSLIGGAVGDALGYPVEFDFYEAIAYMYGEEGITSYTCDLSGKAKISDDTQMTLFTATGLLWGESRGAMRGLMSYPTKYVEIEYRNWYALQMGKEVGKNLYGFSSWLSKVPAMQALRAPGNTCLLALSKKQERDIEHPINDSKGCGGIMRIAPVGLYYNRQPKVNERIEEVDKLAAQVAAITHGHALGYLPAAVLAHIINRIVYGGCKYGDELKGIVVESLEMVNQIYHNKEEIYLMNRLVNQAIDLAKNDLSDVENIHRLGGGWVAEETLAIAVYCSLKYSNDFSRAIIASVNHSGDSDSTGAVTGNIVGAICGYETIEDKWKEKLECKNEILKIADELCENYYVY